SALFDGQLAGTRAVKRPSQTGQASTINRTPQQAFRKISKSDLLQRHPPQSFPRRRFQARYVGHLSQSHHSNISGPHPASESSQRWQQCGRPQPHGVDWDVHGTADLVCYLSCPTSTSHRSLRSYLFTRIPQLTHSTVLIPPNQSLHCF
ncbi:hypothetical protein PSTT_05922, partial [Puccinia striiformis]